LRFFLTSKMN